MKKSLFVVVVMILISFYAKADCLESVDLPIIPEPNGSVRLLEGNM